MMPMDDECDPLVSEAGAAAVAPVNALNGSSLDSLVTIGEAARLFHRTPRTLRNWRSRGWLRAVRIAGGLYFRAAEIEALLTAGRPDRPRIDAAVEAATEPTDVAPA